ncbi:hypothetical protein THARTR1_08956 [Trichoderma harzianum]|uniref:Uncharacterized protein n=1 Tax=Trichoderma harzianum TaxID=5544 RepID=A0A2K0TXW9_TRIHA|nr:hypothetical protein THARTR1_08956 [Trichoderma harzianum]
MSQDHGQCQALHLSDGSKCTKEATHTDGVFCWFHSKQVYGLYKGYKRRNARLDELESEAPPYLKTSKLPLANQTFEDVQDQETLRTVHSHLFDRYVLTGQVIDARRLHHAHFYSLQIDYGHQAYLDKLSSNRHIILRSLWIGKANCRRAVPAGEMLPCSSVTRDKLQARLEQARREEEQKSQDAYLEAAFRERMDMSADEWESDEAWDPIKDTDHDKRNQYIDLIRHFLWMDVADIDSSQDPPAEPEPKAQAEEAAEQPQEENDQKPSKKGKKKAKAKTSAVKPGNQGSAGDSPTADRGQDKLMAMQQNKAKKAADQQMPDKSNIETEQEMRKRLSQGVDKKLENLWGFQFVGSLENPHETFTRTAPMTHDEIETAIKDVREIKLLLFCRLLLAQASLLPAALRASSVDEFLNDAEIVDSDLRDICLKLEDPSLQQIRDACADFARGDDAEVDAGDEPTDDSDSEDEEEFGDMMGDYDQYRNLHTDEWFLNKLADRQGLREPRQKSISSSQRSRVAICGKSVWNHASEKAMSRDGWLQFSIIAKDCDLKHAIQLCRNWAELADLNLLTLWQFFPASNWTSWGNNRLIQQLHELQFFPYFIDLEAQQRNRHFQAGGRGKGRRQHDMIETRNIIAGHMKHRDPVTRRFLQYLTMRTGELLVLVRDGKTGRVITAPPKKHLWTYRRKQGIGSASKNEWQNALEVGPDYFDMTDALREWRFGFDDYYDVFIWNLVPNESPLLLYNVIITELRTAWRMTQPADMYSHMEPQLRSLTREEDTMRTRKINPAEQVKSLWDVVTSGDVEFRLFSTAGTSTSFTPEGAAVGEMANSPYLFYTKANTVEDEILFPDELTSNKKNVHFREIRNPVSRLEHSGPPGQTRFWEKSLTAILAGEDFKEPLSKELDSDEDSMWALPAIWKTGLEKLLRGTLSEDQREVLEETGLDAIKQSQLLADRLENADPTEIMERERSTEFKMAFHEGGLEPGCTERYLQVQEIITTMLKTAQAESADWVYYIALLMHWLEVEAPDDDYYGDYGSDPWSHAFIVQDMVQAFSTMAMFFPEVDTTAHVTAFLKSDQYEGFRNSALFDPRERRKSRPDRRSRASYKYRDAKFWTEWKAILEKDRHFSDIYPFDWSLAIRPIIAKLYRAGVMAPAHLENDSRIVPGVATANTEPHRPDTLDLFINYDDPRKLFPATSFLDSVSRPWEWKFLPKDMPGSELSMHNTTAKALENVKERLQDRIAYRGDLILVMAEDVAELLKNCTAATFAVQTRPWLREIDLWKSFVNVDLDLLKGLDPVWLD